MDAEQFQKQLSYLKAMQYLKEFRDEGDLSPAELSSAELILSRRINPLIRDFDPEEKNG
ncbi:MAG: hypothetical protein ACQGQO_11150 [Sphaerochaetaceae bacterium]|jgi:hypothetical protein